MNRIFMVHTFQVSLYEHVQYDRHRKRRPEMWWIREMHSHSQTQVLCKTCRTQPTSIITCNTTIKNCRNNSKPVWPTNWTIKEHFFPSRHPKTVQPIQEDACTADLWSSKRTEPYISLTVYFLGQDFELKLSTDSLLPQRKHCMWTKYNQTFPTAWTALKVAFLAYSDTLYAHCV